jgi:hypothetical protein
MTVRSDDHFGQMMILSNDHLGQLIFGIDFRSNDHFGKVVFGQTVLGKMAQTRFTIL